METQDYVSPSVELEPEDEKSAFDRFADVFTAPAAAYAGLSQAKKGPIILWGLLILALVSIFAVILFSSNDELRASAQEKQLEQVEKMRDSGRMSEEQYEQQVEAMEAMGSSGIFMAIGVITGAIGTALYALFAGLIVFILMKILERDSRGSAAYSTALAAALIAFMITNVESIITAVGMYFTSNPDFRISPAAFGAPENSFLSFAVNLLNPFTLWLWFALGTGLSVLTGADKGRSIGFVAGAYIVVGLIFAGIAALFGSIFVG